MSFGAYEFETEHDGAGHKAYASIDGAKTRVANFKSSDAKEFQADLQKALKKPLRSVIVGALYEIHVQALDDKRHMVTISAAPKLDPNVKPTFTAKQGEYLAFIHHYTKVHRCPPAESDIQRYFRVSGPSIHEMIRTLEREGFIEKTPRVARSIRVLVESKYLPDLR